jgi:hypothetical protein
MLGHPASTPQLQWYGSGYWLRARGRKLGVEGHKDAGGSITQCPGPQWPGWREDVMSRIPPSS